VGAYEPLWKPTGDTIWPRDRGQRLTTGIPRRELTAPIPTTLLTFETQPILLDDLLEAMHVNGRHDLSVSCLNG